MTSYQKEPTTQWKLEDWRWQTGLRWSQKLPGTLEFIAVFHIWESLASAIVRGVLSLTPSKENRNLCLSNTKRLKCQSNKSLRRGDNDKQYIWFGRNETKPHHSLTQLCAMLTVFCIIHVFSPSFFLVTYVCQRHRFQFPQMQWSGHD